jgi:hypothetical protein
VHPWIPVPDADPQVTSRWPPTVPITLAADGYGRHAAPGHRPTVPPHAVPPHAVPPHAVPAGQDRWRAVRDLTVRFRGLRRTAPSAAGSAPPRVPGAERAAMLRRWE